MSVPKRKSSSGKASAKKQKNLVDELNSARDDYRSSLMSQTFLESSNNDLPYSRTRSQKNSTKNSSPSVTSSTSLPSATNSASPLLTTDPISKSITPNTSSTPFASNSTSTNSMIPPNQQNPGTNLFRLTLFLSHFC